MARDGTNRGGRRVRAGDKPAPAAEKIQKGQQVQILNNDIPTLSPTELEAVDLPEGAVMNGVDMPKPSDYLSARQKNGIPLGADEIYKETWLWLKERNCEKLVNPRLIEAYAQAFVCRSKEIPFISVKYVTDIIGQNSVKHWEDKLADARQGLSHYFNVLKERI